MWMGGRSIGGDALGGCRRSGPADTLGRKVGYRITKMNECHIIKLSFLSYVAVMQYEPFIPQLGTL